MATSIAVNSLCCMVGQSPLHGPHLSIAYEPRKQYVRSHALCASHIPPPPCVCVQKAAVAAKDIEAARTREDRHAQVGLACNRT